MAMDDMLNVIDDFRFDYRFLSNFQASTVLYDGELYPTVENAYQAAKTLDLAAREPFTRISAKQAKQLGKEVKLRKDWDSIKDITMYGLLTQKFTIPLLRKKLLATGDALLVEGNWWNDTYWGVCNGKGKNVLGILLMKVRKDIREEL